MTPPPVSGRPPGSSDASSLGGPTLKISGDLDVFCPVNRPSNLSENPNSPAIVIALPYGDRPVTNVVPFESSLSDEGLVQISCNSEPVCPAISGLQFPPALFTGGSTGVLQIPVASGNVCSSGAPILDPCLPALQMVSSDHPSAFPIDGNFRSTTDFTIHSSSSSRFANSGRVSAPLFNPFGRSVPQGMGKHVRAPIPANLRPIGNAQFSGFRPSFTSKASELGHLKAGSGLASTGSGLPAPSPTYGGGQITGQCVDPGESMGQPGRVDSACNSVRFVTPGVSDGAPVHSVPPTVSFRDILGRAASSRPHLAFPDGGFLSELPSSTGEVPVQSVWDGIPGIVFPDQLISSLSARFRFALVGRVSGNRRLTPNSDILAALSCTGLLGSHTVQFLPWGYLVLTLSCEEDYLRFWSQPDISIRSVVIRFYKWTPEFTLEADSSVVPVWVRLPDLPLHLYDRQSLFHIAKLLGHPVQVEQYTADGSKGSYARVCVEIDVLAPRPEQIWVGWGSHYVHLDVVYERVPFFCSECMMLGHSSQRCVRSDYPSAAARAKAQGKRPVGSPSAAPSSTVPQSDVPSGSGSVPLEPGWQRQRRGRRPHRCPGPTSYFPSGNSFGVLQGQGGSGPGDSSDCDLSRDLDTIVEDIPYESEFPAMAVPHVLSDYVSGPVVMRIDPPVVSTVDSGATQGSLVEVSPLPVVDTPVVHSPVSGVVALTPQVEIVAPMVVSDPVVSVPVVAPSVRPVFPKFSSIPDSDKRVKTSAGADAATSRSLPLPVRTRSQHRSFKKQQVRASLPYDRPIDPG